MKLISVAVCIICAICISSIECLSNHSHGIQIITPVNHSYTLQLDELKRILEVDDIKDRHVVVVSIAGAFRQGKSFLLNFFIRYLNAQVRVWFDFKIRFLSEMERRRKIKNRSGLELPKNCYHLTSKQIY